MNLRARMDDGVINIPPSTLQAICLEAEKIQADREKEIVDEIRKNSPLCGIKDKDGVRMVHGDRAQLVSDIDDVQIIYEGEVRYMASIGFHILVDKEIIDGEERIIPKNKRKPIVRKRTVKLGD